MSFMYRKEVRVIEGCAVGKIVNRTLNSVFLSFTSIAEKEC